MTSHHSWNVEGQTIQSESRNGFPLLASNSPAVTAGWCFGLVTMVWCWRTTDRWTNCDDTCTCVSLHIIVVALLGARCNLKCACAWFPIHHHNTTIHVCTAGRGGLLNNLCAVMRTWQIPDDQARRIPGRGSRGFYAFGAAWQFN